MPFISYMRNILIGISLFLFVKSPFAQVSIIGFIEIVYTIIIVIFRTKAKKVDNIIDVFNTLTNSSFVSLKFLTLCNIGDDTGQQVLGTLMTIIIVTSIIGNILYVVYSIIITILEVFGYVEGDDKGKLAEGMESKWKQSVIIYEYPAQPLVFDGEREAKPMVVDRCEEDMMEEIDQEKFVSSKKAFIRGEKEEAMAETEESPLNQKVFQGKTELRSNNFGQKSKDGERSEGIGLFPVQKVEERGLQDDFRVEIISEEKVR